MLAAPRDGERVLMKPSRFVEELPAGDQAPYERWSLDEELPLLALPRPESREALAEAALRLLGAPAPALPDGSGIANAVNPAAALGLAQPAAASPPLDPAGRAAADHVDEADAPAAALDLTGPASAPLAPAGRAATGAGHVDEADASAAAGVGEATEAEGAAGTGRGRAGLSE
jgi:hypothetical protein